jgi:type II secretory pathway component PulF
MITFSCRVADRQGKIQELVRDSISEETLVRQFSSEGLFALKITPLDPGAQKTSQRFSRQTVMEFTEAIAMLIDSGLSIRDALEVCQTIYETGKTHQLISAILSRLKKGGSLSSIINEFDSSFPPVYCGLIRIGERIGSLEKVFRQLALYMGDEKKLKEKIQSSLMYPVLVLVVTIFGVIGIVLVVFPKIKGMIQALGQNSSINPDKLLASMTITLIVLPVLFAICIGVALFIYFGRKSRGSLALGIDSMLLKTPLVGQTIERTELFLFSFAMEVLTSNGVAVEDALEESAEVVSNRAYQTGIRTIKNKIENGVPMSQAMISCPQFPRQMGHWIAIGERTGSVDKVFGQLKKYYQNELEKWTTRFTELLGPALILVVGALMLYLVFSFIIPIFSIFGTISI